MRTLPFAMLAVPLVWGLLAGGAAAQLRWDFADRPTDEQRDAAWPAQAKAAGRGGNATALCDVDPAGAVSGCRVISEEPKGDGFGEALLGLAPSYRMGFMTPACTTFYNKVAIGVEWSNSDRKVEWRRRPSYEDLMFAYPKNALKERVWGFAVLECRIGADAKLTACTTPAEGPEGQGFGEAALKLARKFALTPPQTGKVKVEGSVVIPINFSMSAVPGCRP